MQRDLWVVIHGDGFTALGRDRDLDWYRRGIQERFKTKVKGRLGPEESDLKEMRVLNRVVQWGEDGIRYEVDQRHAEVIAQEMGMKEESKGAATPGIKSREEGLEGQEELIPEEASRHRALAARANYLA